MIITMLLCYYYAILDHESSRELEHHKETPKSELSFRATASSIWNNCDVREAAAEAREKLRIVFKKIAETGSKLCISFDEATMLGSDRYSTLNVYHYEELLANSRVTTLELIRVEERATGLVIGIIHANAQVSRTPSCGYRQRLRQFISKPHIVSLQVSHVGRCHPNMVGDQREFSSISSRSGGILEKYLTRTLKNVP